MDGGRRLWWPIWPGAVRRSAAWVFGIGGQHGGTMGMKRHSSSFGGSVVGVFGLKFLPMVVINIFEGE